MCPLRGVQPTTDQAVDALVGALWEGFGHVTDILDGAAGRPTSHRADYAGGFGQAAKAFQARDGAVGPIEIHNGLPHPPLDREKYLYVKRNAWVLITCSVLSFIALLVSQVRMIMVSPWFWAYLPFLAFTILYFLISLVVTVGTRDFDLKAHQQLVRG